MTETRSSAAAAKRSAQRGKKRRSSADLVVIAALMLLLIALLAAAFIVRSKNSVVYKTNTLEAGNVTLTPEMFLKDETKEIAFQEGFDPAGIDTRTPGTYTILLVSGRTKYTCELVIQDTTPPAAEANPKTVTLGTVLKAEELVKNVIDNSYIFAITYVDTPDFNKSGTYNVQIRIQDAGGNNTVVASTLTVEPAHGDVPVVNPKDDQPAVPDTEAPVIYGVHDITVYVGEGISYFSGVYAEDNIDGSVSVDVDADSVNTKAAGKYTVTYTATDRAGNTAAATAAITVVERTVDEDTVRQLASSVISNIITDDMTGYEKLSAIYSWVRKNVSYSESTEKDDWLKAAYQGFHDHKGDCFTYQMTSKALLDAAGIENKLIDTVPLRYLHCWNLVNIGDGWYHFDATPRKGGFDGLYLDDNTLMAYSETHSNSHIYDHEKFPGVVTGDDSVAD